MSGKKVAKATEVVIHRSSFIIHCSRKTHVRCPQEEFALGSMEWPAAVIAGR